MARRRSGPEILAQAGDLLVQRDADRPSGRLLRQGDMDASYVDLADPRHLEFDYLRRMRDVVEALRARRIVHVGGAGAALARALAATRPTPAPGAGGDRPDADAAPGRRRGRSRRRRAGARAPRPAQAAGPEGPDRRRARLP